MIGEEIGKKIDTMLESFGSSRYHTLGFYCKKYAVVGCTHCELCFVCNRNPPIKKVDWLDDYLIRNLTYGWPLQKDEFHAEIAHYGGKPQKKEPTK